MVSENTEPQNVQDARARKAKLQAAYDKAIEAQSMGIGDRNITMQRLEVLYEQISIQDAIISTYENGGPFGRIILY